MGWGWGVITKFVTLWLQRVVLGGFSKLLSVIRGGIRVFFCLLSVIRGGIRVVFESVKCYRGWYWGGIALCKISIF